MAWLAVLPCALLLAAALLVLGSPLGELVHGNDYSRQLWQGLAFAVRPEPTEHARYLIAIAAPFAYAAIVVRAAATPVRLPAKLVVWAVGSTQVLVAIFVAACLVTQARVWYGPVYGFTADAHFRHAYFTPPTLIAAAGIALAVVLLVRADAWRARGAHLFAARGWPQPAAVAAAVLATAVWLTHAIYTDASLASAFGAVADNVMYTSDEVFAVLNGRTPLVDFTAQYASLLPYPVALVMLAFGKTILVFTLAMTALTGVALLAVFDVLRRVTRSAVAALALYLPFLATSLYTMRGTRLDRYTDANYFAIFPLRQLGPCLLAWLTVRELGRERVRPGGPFLVFGVAGLVIWNNVEFGLPAAGATAVALVWAGPRRGLRELMRWAGAAALGLAAATVLVAALGLLRAGALPEPERLVEYARVYAQGGFALMRIVSTLGLHLVIYLTFVAAIATATVLGIRRDGNRALVGMLAWAGTFGLGAGSYFVGRSHPDALVASFSTWSLVLALLTVVVVRRLAREHGSRTPLASLLVLFGMGVAVCSLALTPTPWSQVERMNRGVGARSLLPARPLVPDPATRGFLAASAYGPRHFHVKRGMPIAILLTTGHRIADAFGVVNVTPYTGIWSIHTAEHLSRTVAALREAGGNTLLMPDIYAETYELLDRWGFEVVTSRGLQSYAEARGTATSYSWLDTIPVTKWVDTRNLRPSYLRDGRGPPVAQRVG